MSELSQRKPTVKRTPPPPEVPSTATVLGGLIVFAAVTAHLWLGFVVNNRRPLQENL
jgi:hypothetical protein